MCIRDSPYTWGLLASIPSLHGDADADLLPIKGNPPSLINIPSGCAFHPRCDFADRTGGRSQTERPELRDGGAGHLAACHLTVEERQHIFDEEIRPKL